MTILLISYSYVFVSSSEDADVGQRSDLCWVPSMALALWPSGKCFRDGCESSHEVLHLLQPPVSCPSDEPIFPPSQAIWGCQLGWHTPFHPLRYPTDRESNSDTRLTPIYLVESDLSKPSCLSVIGLTSDLSSSSAFIPLRDFPCNRIILVHCLVEAQYVISVGHIVHDCY